MNITNNLIEFGNKQNDQIQQLKPIQIVMMAAVVSGTFIFYLGKEYAFYSNFVIMQSIMILTLLQLAQTKKSMFTIISLSVLFVLYLIIIMFRVTSVLSDNNNVLFLTKLIILVFVLINVHPPINNSPLIKFLCILSIIILIIWNIIELLSMFYLTRAD